MSRQTSTASPTWAVPSRSVIPRVVVPANAELGSVRRLLLTVALSDASPSTTSRAMALRSVH